MAIHPNITRVWTEWVLENGAMDTELVIETNLSLNPHDPQEMARLDELVNFAVAQNANGNHRRVRVISIANS